MESLQTTKIRLKAVKNVGQITKAMEVVAATKMRRAQESALNSRPYAFEALQLLERVVDQTLIKNPLLEIRDIKKTVVMIVSSDRGLAGSFNSQVFKLADHFFNTDNFAEIKDHEYLIVTVGKKSLNYTNRKNYKLLRNFDNSLDVTSLDDVSEMSTYLISGFLGKKWDRVVTVSTHFRTALKQETLIRQILPLSVEKIRDTIREIVPEHGRYSENTYEPQLLKDDKVEYIFEPNPSEVLTALMPHLLEMQIYHLFLEAKASEHSARRVAMKTASDNAAELGDSLLMQYNKARQVGITRELAEITTTIMTLE